MKNRFTFMGVPACNPSINIPRGDVMRCGSQLFPIKNYDPPILSFSLSYIGYMDKLISELLTTRYGNFIILSPSGVCQHCGSYFTAGTLKCANCHGYVQDELVSVKQSRFECIYGEFDDILTMGQNEEQEYIHLELSIEEAAIDSIMHTLRMDVIPNSFKLYEDYILCDCCLSIVKAGDKCPRCHGARIPFSELIQIDRQCIFCGTKTYNGVMCHKCGASLAGISYREYYKNSLENLI